MNTVKPQDVTCPRCAAPPRQRCMSETGGVIRTPHHERREAAFKAESERRLLLGVCPECISEEDLDDHGLIVPHKQLYGLARTDVDCPGAGQKPEVEP